VGAIVLCIVFIDFFVFLCLTAAPGDCDDEKMNINDNWLICKAIGGSSRGKTQ
jgi:hypothetical protein